MSAIRKEVVIGDCRLLLGDCLKILPELGKVEAVVTDPPYFGREDLFPTEQVSDVMALLSGADAFIFWPWYGEAPLPKPSAVHIWHKSVPIHPNSTTGNVAGHQYERVFSYGLGSRAEVFRCEAIMPNFAACANEFAEHPTQKPLRLVNELVKRTRARTVLDPFMGSGTTGVSCVKLGRSFIGIEIDEGYFDIACARIQKACDQPDIFLEAERPPAPIQQGFDLGGG